MLKNHHIIKAVQAAWEHEAQINLHTHPVTMSYENEVLTLEGEVQDVAAKKLCMELAIAVPGVTGIVDRLHVTPAMRIGDGAILAAVRDVLLQEPALQDCAVRVRNKGRVETIRESAAPNFGVIELSVNDGVVLLDDHVPSLGQKRLAGVLAWWVPGSRDVLVINDVQRRMAQNDAWYVFGVDKVINMLQMQT
jgi:osmotically-inducible protein OsmY